MASTALAEKLRMMRPRQVLHLLRRKDSPPPAHIASFHPYVKKQQRRREKSLKTISGLQLQRFRGGSAALAFFAAASISFRVSFWALVKAFRFSTRKQFSNARS